MEDGSVSFNINAVGKYFTPDAVISDLETN